MKMHDASIANVETSISGSSNFDDVQFVVVVWHRALALSCHLGTNNVEI
jgi:hypothetical protein